MSSRFSLYVLLCLVACGTSACLSSTLPAVPAGTRLSSPKPDNTSAASGPGERPITQYTIKGRVQMPTLTVPEGAHIAVYQVRDDGRLAPVSGTVTSSDQEGRFTVEVSLRESVDSDLMVRADSSAGYGFAVVPTALSVDKVIPAPPIDEETTVEAQVYLAAKGAGIWPEDLHVGRLSGLLSPRLARVALQDRDFAAAVQALSRAGTAAASAWSSVLQNPAVGVQDEQLKSIHAALDWSQYTLASGLNSARTLQEADIVRADFQAGIPLAYGLAAIRPYQLVLAAQATASTFELYARDLSHDSRAQAWVDMELQRAAYVANAVNELFYQMGDVATRAQVRSLSEALLLRIAHQQGEPAAVESAIHTAWIDYRSAVLAAVQSRVKAFNKSVWDQAQASLQKRATAASEALSQLKTETAPMDNAAEAAQIMGQVMTEVKAQAKALSGRDGPQAQAQAIALLSVVENLDLACKEN